MVDKHNQASVVGSSSGGIWWWDLAAVAFGRDPTPPRSTTDLFGDPVDAHPLWFKPSSFLDQGFDSNSYITDLRTFVPFETLRSELHSHLSSLKNELVELIN